MKRGKRYNLVKRNIAVGMLLAMLNSMLFADIKVDKNIPQNTSVDRAPNGANIININTPNSKGISVNDFSEFRTKDPTVFNNFGSGVGRSYLAGMMAANPNLTKEQAARLILNRVGGNNRVEIENWLEVMSENKTDLIFSKRPAYRQSALYKDTSREIGYLVDWLMDGWADAPIGKLSLPRKEEVGDSLNCLKLMYMSQEIAGARKYFVNHLCIIDEGKNAVR